MDDKIDQAETAKGVHADNVENQQPHDPNAPRTMDPARRAAVEKSMKRKLDTRCSLFVLIYILSRFSSAVQWLFYRNLHEEQQTTSTETTSLPPVFAVCKMTSSSTTRNTPPV